MTVGLLMIFEYINEHGRNENWCQSLAVYFLQLNYIYYNQADQD